MAFGFRKEQDYEDWWLRPFAARVRMPGYKLEVFRSTKLFFHLYWRLRVSVGYTEQEIADHAVRWGSRSRLPKEIVLTQAVFDLAELHGIEAREPFMPFADA